MSRPLLSIEDLQIAFEGRTVVDRLSLEVATGERVALVGESGSGKSVTALSILGLLGAARVKGRLSFEGEDLLERSERHLQTIRGRQIAMVFQEPMTALNPLYPVGTQIAEVLRLHKGMSRRDARRESINLLIRTGIEDAPHKIDAFAHQLSGGQRQRAMIAMAIACRPKLLIADEPTTALDVTVRAQIVELLLALQAEEARREGMAILLITHDLQLVRRFAQRVAVMERGRLVETADTAAVFASASHPYTRHLIASTPSREVPTVRPGQAPVLDVKDIAVEYPVPGGGLSGWLTRQRRSAVRNISFDLSPGETLGIVGESGSGKSTLAAAILGLQAAVRGEVRLKGRRFVGPGAAVRRELRASIQAVFQDPFGSLSPRESIGQIVGEGLALHHPGLSSSEQRSRVEQALQEVGLPAEAMSRHPHEFSGGQRQRIAIARALILKPDVLVLDEPTTALDTSIQRQVLQLLSRLQARHGLSYLLISHDLSVMKAMAHRVLVMQAGEAVEQGPVERILYQPVHPHTRALLAASDAT